MQLGGTPAPHTGQETQPSVLTLTTQVGLDVGEDDQEGMLLLPHSWFRPSASGHGCEAQTSGARAGEVTSATI